MISNVSPKLCGLLNVVRIVLILSDRFNLRILCRATRNARRDLSIAIPEELGIFRARLHMMQPVPVPKSKIRGDVQSLHWVITDSTNVSVSGRGSSVCLFV